MGRLRIILLIFLLQIFVSCSNNSHKIVYQKSGVKQNLFSISIVDNNTVWISGSSGKILKTIDGGKNWETCTSPLQKKFSFRGIYAFNKDTCIVMSVGAPGYIFKTYNGGKTWGQKYWNPDPDIFLNSIDFWDNEKGIAVGDPCCGGFTVLVTNNQGETWSRIPIKNIPSPSEGEIQYASSNSCIAVSDSGLAWFVTGGTESRIFKTTDYGKTWKVFKTPVVNGAELSGIFSTTFYDSLTGIVAGGKYLKPSDTDNTFAITHDGGETWTQPDSMPPIGFCSCAIFPFTNDKNTILTAGLNGIAVTYNMGLTWKLLSNKSFNVIKFSDKDQFGWAAGNSGQIAKIIW